jgi:hypothetical protein
LEKEEDDRRDEIARDANEKDIDRTIEGGANQFYSQFLAPPPFFLIERLSTVEDKMDGAATQQNNADRKKIGAWPDAVIDDRRISTKDQINSLADPNDTDR